MLTLSALATRIDAMIDAGRFAPGDRLPAERPWASELGVSRSQLREAIKQLGSRGRLTSRRGGGTYVTAPGDVDPIREALLPLETLAQSESGYWRDVMEIRQSLEGDAAAHAASRADPADRNAMTAAYDRLSAGLLAEHPADAGSPLALATLDAAFHRSIARAARNVVLYQVMTGLEGLLAASISDTLVRLYRLPGVAVRLDAQHRRILDAVLDGKPDAARAAALDHLRFVEDRIEHLQQNAERHRRTLNALRHLPMDTPSPP
ncbi:FCD domain-containing protein [Luteibacter sp. PPL201]|uniref:Pyruvate dehydrogenase complex repressor n=1 Tax=Luteibacter sahnii TaxID=3021977 RepID=A0ABT6BCS7_9GAMM|nr:FCD domain-containing protein [Luteibacter sp. PPL193]MDY1549263.1 FCD domain-containing protein [Luteibacter sp. PPL193]